MIRRRSPGASIAALLFFAALFGENGLARGGVNPLMPAVASGRVEDVRRLLEAGADPNAVDRDGVAIVHWLGSRPHPVDDDILAVAELLDRHHCDFKEGRVPPSANLVTNLAPRHVPKTLAFLTKKGITDDYVPALRAVARGGDLASVEVLLDAGADPLAGAALGGALFVAAAEGQTAAAATMLKRVKDKDAPKVLAAYRAALGNGHSRTAQAFIDGGMKAPHAAPPRSQCAAKELTPEQSALLARLGLPNASGLAGLAGGMNCKLIQECGNFLLVDCNSAADGPAYYIERREPKVLATCGGACMRGCTNCPPAEWRCACGL